MFFILRTLGLSASITLKFSSVERMSRVSGQKDVWISDIDHLLITKTLNRGQFQKKNNTDFEFQLLPGLPDLFCVRHE